MVVIKYHSQGDRDLSASYECMWQRVTTHSQKDTFTLFLARWRDGAKGA